MPELADVMRRLDGIEEQLKNQTDLMVKIATQQKDITHLQDEVIAIRVKINDDTDKRLRTLEEVHNKCQIAHVERSLNKIWAYFWAIVCLFVATAVGFFWKQQ